MYTPSILLIGDDAESLCRRAELLARAGREVEFAVGGNRGILACTARLFDVIVVFADDDGAAEKLAFDLGIVSPVSEILNVNKWYAAGLRPEHEPGLLLSFFAGAIHPAPNCRDSCLAQTADARHARRRIA